MEEGHSEHLTENWKRLLGHHANRFVAPFPFLLSLLPKHFRLEKSLSIRKPSFITLHILLFRINPRWENVSFGLASRTENRKPLSATFHLSHTHWNIAHLSARKIGCQDGERQVSKDHVYVSVVCASNFTCNATSFTFTLRSGKFMYFLHVIVKCSCTPLPTLSFFAAADGSGVCVTGCCIFHMDQWWCIHCWSQMSMNIWCCNIVSFETNKSSGDTLASAVVLRKEFFSWGCWREVRQCWTPWASI